MKRTNSGKARILAVFMAMTLMLSGIVVINTEVAYAAAADYYVRAGASGANDGSDWDNAWNGFSAINWNVIDPGSIIWVAGGTYGNLVIDKSGAAGSPITVKRATELLHGSGAGWASAYDGQVIIDGNGSTSDTVAIQIGASVYADYITIDGATKYGIWLRNAKYGISTRGPGEWKANNLTVRNVEIGDPGAYKIGEDAIQGRGNDLLVENSYLHDCDNIETHGDGIQWYGGNNITVRYNVFKNNGQMMIVGEDYWGPEYANDINIYYNIFYNRSGNHYDGIRLKLAAQSGHYVNIFNNVFDLRGATDRAVSWYIKEGDINFKNNAVMASNCGPIGDTIHSNNAYVDSGAYQCTGIPYEIGMVVNDDLGFTDLEAADYHPTGSSLLRNAGTDIGLTADFDGNAAANPPCIGAFQYTGTEPAPTPKPSPTPPPPPNPDAWYSMTNFAQVQDLGPDNTGMVTMEYDITPLQDLSLYGGLVAYSDSSTTITGYSSLPIIIRLNPAGIFDARNGADYMASVSVPYSLNNSYHMKITANLPAKTYDVWVTSDGTDYQIADDYAFRSDAPVPDDLGKICLMSEGGNNQFMIMDHTLSSGEPDTTPTPPTPTPEPDPAGWYSKKDFSQIKNIGTGNTGTVTVEYDVKPQFSNIDGVTGYADSSTMINGYSSLAVIVRMHPSGYFDAINGSDYAKLANVTYTANALYHVKIVADMPSRNYDVWITPPGGQPVMIADNYAFRDSAPDTDDLGKILLKCETTDDVYVITNHTPAAVEKLADIAAAPAPGVYAVSQSVVLTADEGASIYYTTDDSVPSDKSTLYEGPVTVSATTIIKAIAYMDGRCSDVFIEKYVIKSPEPYGVPAQGTYGGTQTVTLLSSDPEMQIYYTLNGDEPTADSTLYTVPITVGGTTTIKAVAVKDGYISPVTELKYTISTGSSLFLKADGKTLRTNYGSGDVTALRGTNIGGWLVQEGWMSPTNAADQKTMIDTFTTRFGADKAQELINAYESSWWQEADFDNIKNLGMNVIRLPFTYFNLLDSEGNMRPDAFDRLDWFVEQCGQKGLYVILDMHGAPGSQNGYDHSGDISGANLFKDKANMEKTVYLWKQIVNRYKGNPNIAGYDLLNEPTGTTRTEELWEFYDVLYKAIREIDPDHAIFLEAVWNPQDMPAPSVYGWENVVYEYHFYEWNKMEDPLYQIASISTKLKMVNEDTNYNVPTFFGEFCMFDSLHSWEYTLNMFNEQGWSWTTWTYKTVGMGNWGMYNSTSSTTPKVDIYHDSYETILEKWSHVDTATRFAKNRLLTDVLSAYADPEAASGDSRKWVQDFEGAGLAITAGDNAIAAFDSTTVKSGEKSARLDVSSSGMPDETARNLRFTPNAGVNLDISNYNYLIINCYDTVGQNTAFVALTDKDGNTWSSWTTGNAQSIKDQWAKMLLDLNEVTGIDKTAIKEIIIGEYNSGTYYFDDIYLAQSFADKEPVLDITGIDEVYVTTLAGLAPNLPQVVEVEYENSTSGKADVIWAPIDSGDYADEGSFTVTGTVVGTTIKALAQVSVEITVDGLASLLEYGAENGLIADNGVLNSLKVKADNVLKYRDSASKALKALKALQNEVQAQSGKKIDKGYASVLLRYIDGLMELYSTGK